MCVDLDRDELAVLEEDAEDLLRTRHRSLEQLVELLAGRCERAVILREGGELLVRQIEHRHDRVTAAHRGDARGVHHKRLEDRVERGDHCVERRFEDELAVVET